MAPQRTGQEADVPVRQVNSILQSLRGEHVRHARNVQGKPASSSSLAQVHTHNRPTLPVDLIYPSPAPTASPPWVPGPSPPKSWRTPAASAPLPTRRAESDVTDTPAGRERALSLLFSPEIAPESARSRPLVYPNPGPVPQLTLLCLRLIRATCPDAGLARVVPYIPPHLRRALLRDTAIHAPLSQVELEALCQGTSHVDTELVVVGPRNTLLESVFRKNDLAIDVAHRDDDDPPGRSESEPGASWDAPQTQGSEPLALRSLAILLCPLRAATVLAFPPTITRLALIRIPHRISLQRLPTICPLLVLLDLSYNAWLYSPEDGDRGKPVLEAVGWSKLRRLEVLGLRACPPTPTLLLELNKGRWEDVKVIQENDVDGDRVL